MEYFKTAGGVGTPFAQVQSHTFKNNGKDISQEEYCKIQSGITNETQGGGLQTTHPDPCGIKARINKERKKNDENRKKNDETPK